MVLFRDSRDTKSLISYSRNRDVDSLLLLLRMEDYLCDFNFARLDLSKPVLLCSYSWSLINSFARAHFKNPLFLTNYQYLRYKGFINEKNGDYDGYVIDFKCAFQPLIQSSVSLMEIIRSSSSSVIIICTDDKLCSMDIFKDYLHSCMHLQMHFFWHLKRLVWIGHLKDSNCLFRTLPRELIKHILSYLVLLQDTNEFDR